MIRIVSNVEKEDIGHAIVQGKFTQNIERDLRIFKRRRKWSNSSILYDIVLVKEGIVVIVVIDVEAVVIVVIDAEVVVTAVTDTAANDLTLDLCHAPEAPHVEEEIVDPAHPSVVAHTVEKIVREVLVALDHPLLESAVPLEVNHQKTAAHHLKKIPRNKKNKVR